MGVAKHHLIDYLHAFAVYHHAKRKKLQSCTGTAQSRQEEGNKKRQASLLFLHQQTEPALTRSPGKSDIQARRNEKLSKKNPNRIQKQIDDLRNITVSGGSLTKHEESVLEALERELKAVKKAREALGDKAPIFFQRHIRDERNALDKRRRNNGDSSEDSGVPEDVQDIPMPRDTPPPIPKEVMDAWHARRRARWQARNQARMVPEQVDQVRDGGRTGEQDRKPKPNVESKTVYESAPQVRDLRKDAVTAFMPPAVRAKMAQTAKGQEDQVEQPAAPLGPKHVTIEDVEDDE